MGERALNFKAPRVPLRKLQTLGLPRLLLARLVPYKEGLDSRGKAGFGASHFRPFATRYVPLHNPPAGHRAPGKTTRKEAFHPMARSSSKAAPKAPAKPVYVLNGPNLNLLGQREPEICGSTTLADIEKQVKATAKSLGLGVVCRQSNHEGDLVDRIQEAREKAATAILNAAAYSHTSIAIHDALATLDIPVIEVHISNVYKRESFRHHSTVSSVATGVICGLGTIGYELALEAVKSNL